MKIKNWLICPDCRVPLKYNKRFFKCEKCKFTEKVILPLSTEFDFFNLDEIEKSISIELLKSEFIQ